MPSPSSFRPRLEQPTREQLDELDALMQRMLALPINPPEEVPFTPPSSPVTATVDPSVLSENMLRNSQPGVPEPGPIAGVSQPGAGTATEERALAGPAGPAPVTEMPQFVPLETSAADQPVAGGEGGGSLELPLFEANRRTEPKTQDGARPAHEQASSSQLRLPGILRPLILLNQCFDSLIGLLGRPGRVLGGDVGRWFFGLAGLAMLAAAATWAALELGWMW
jgi:hypothetical protein